MKKTLILMISVLFLVSILGFALADNSENSNNLISEKGEIKYMDLEGGCWIIETTDEIQYEPINLEEEYKQDGLEIEFKGQITTDYMSICQIGTLIEITEIEIEDETEIEDDEENENSEWAKTKRIRLRINQSELPEGCLVSGSVLKCNIDDKRVMAVFAGNSGNTILQVKGINASTKTQLYKENSSFYAKGKDNETILINYFPDEVREMIRNRISAEIEGEEEIELNEEGYYQVQTKKRARLFLIVPVKEKVKSKVNAETGEIIRIRNPWWGFLAKDIQEEPLLGEDCGTVSPDFVDECCQNKGYDQWNSEKFECVYLE